MFLSQSHLVCWGFSLFYLPLWREQTEFALYAHLSWPPAVLYRSRIEACKNSCLETYWYSSHLQSAYFISYQPVSPFIAITPEYMLVWDTIPEMEFRLEEDKMLQFISGTKVVRERKGTFIWEVASAGAFNPQKRYVQYCTSKFEHVWKDRKERKKKKKGTFL